MVATRGSQPAHPLPKLPTVIRQRREKLGYSQYEVALFLGVTQEAVSRWENGNRVPGGAHLVKLLRLLQLTQEQVA